MLTSLYMYQWIISIVYLSIYGYAAKGCIGNLGTCMYMYLKILLNQQLIRHKLKLVAFICKLPHIKKGKTRLFLFSHFLDYFQLVSYIEMHKFRQNTSSWIFKKISVKNWPNFTILTCFGFFLVQKVDSKKTLGIFPSFPSPLCFSLG